MKSIKTTSCINRIAAVAILSCKHVGKGRFKSKKFII